MGFNWDWDEYQFVIMLLQTNANVDYLFDVYANTLMCIILVSNAPVLCFYMI
jgi:hypothetical protein